MSFPKKLSLTVTNVCNLRCRMCGQWSEDGYIRQADRIPPGMRLPDWKRLVDEAAAHGVSWVLVRGGEPFLFPGIIELLAYLQEKKLTTSVDTNGTMLKHFAADLAALGDLELTISVDGPPQIHDAVRGVKGTFQRIEEGVAAIHEAEKVSGRKVTLAIAFTITPYSYLGLGDMADVARRLSIPTICLLPYYYFPEAVGLQYERELAGLGCPTFSWRGFHHEESGIDFEEFLRQFRRFKAELGAVKVYPYIDFSEEEYRVWFQDTTTPVGRTECWSLDEFLDIQPGGEANFCVDFPDYSIGSVANATIEELWNGERAERFRERRRRNPLAVCHRCGAKYMAAPRDAESRHPH